MPEVFDKAEALDRVAGSDEILQEICEVFLETLPEMLQAIRAPLARGDLARTAEGAHALKGASANLSAWALREASARLEQAARAGEMNQAVQLREAVESCADALRTVLQKLAGGGTRCES